MSKIEDLIKRYCPDGVEWKKIRDVYVRLRGTPITAGKMKEIADENGDIRVFAGGKTVIDTFEKDIPDANVIRVPAVLVQSRGIIDFVYYDKPFTFKNEMWAYTHEDEMCVKYLYYVLKNHLRKFKNEASGMGSMPQISLGVTEDFVIPIPPRPVQDEIVRILDKFTELEKELEKELELRRKQYEWYRDKLLTFDGGVEWKRLGDVAEICTGSRNTQDAVENGRYDFFVRSQIPLKLDEYDYDDESVVTAGDGVGVGKVFHITHGKYALHQRAYRIHPLDKFVLNVKYLYYVFSNNFYDYIMMQKYNGSVASVRLPMLKEFEIPVPSLTEQERIVKILDKFDTLTTSLTSGLPAEIKLRKQQYEYYRDYLFGLLR